MASEYMFNHFELIAMNQKHFGIFKFELVPQNFDQVHFFGFFLLLALPCYQFPPTHSAWYHSLWMFNYIWTKSEFWAIALIV